MASEGKTKDHTKDHGGDIDRARAAYGGELSGWIDLSTGINPRPYPLPPLPPNAWTALPTRADMSALLSAAGEAYCTKAPIAALAGAQAAIQMAPRLRPKGQVRILGPTYNEHANAFRTEGWEVTEVREISELVGAEVAIIVNPNNPDGQRTSPKDLQPLIQKTGFLVIDESFADPHPDLSLAPTVDPESENILILRSFGKFYGLAGLRLGFAIGGKATIEAIRAASGPWPISGPAIEIARTALNDRNWQQETIKRLAADAAHLDELAEQAGWRIVGGTTLFRLYDVGNAARAQDQLAKAHIWSRVFPYSKTWLRLGLPDGETAWQRLENALTA